MCIKVAGMALFSSSPMTFRTAIACLAGLSVSCSAAEQPAASKSDSAKAAHNLVVDGERFSVRQVIDHKLQDSVAFRFSVPEKWRDSSQIYWEFGNINIPVTMAAKAENPANDQHENGDWQLMPLAR
jgi:hypothetical protein